MYALSDTFSNVAAIQRRNQDNSVKWQFTTSCDSVEKSLSIDHTEANVYFGQHSGQFVIAQLLAETGAFQSGQSYSSIFGTIHDIRIYILNDDSGYIFIAQRSPSQNVYF